MQKILTNSFLYEHISAVFKKIEENEYDVILEINSNKFLIHLTTNFNKIEKFEIIAAKGFIEISASLIKILKNLIYHLYIEH